MEKTYISWNFVNWITIVLMATIGMAVVGAAASYVRAQTGTSKAG